MPGAPKRTRPPSDGSGLRATTAGSTFRPPPKAKPAQPVSAFRRNMPPGGGDFNVNTFDPRMAPPSGGIYAGGPDPRTAIVDGPAGGPSVGFGGGAPSAGVQPGGQMGNRVASPWGGGGADDQAFHSLPMPPVGGPSYWDDMRAMPMPPVPQGGQFTPTTGGGFTAPPGGPQFTSGGGLQSPDVPTPRPPLHAPNLEAQWANPGAGQGGLRDFQRRNGTGADAMQRWLQMRAARNPRSVQGPPMRSMPTPPTGGPSPNVPYGNDGVSMPIPSGPAVPTPAPPGLRFGNRFGGRGGGGGRG